MACDVAAMVIERSEGSSYAEVIAERFSRPLNLAAFVWPVRCTGDATGRAAVAPARLDDGRTTGVTWGSWFVSADGKQR